MARRAWRGSIKYPREIFNFRFGRGKACLDRSGCDITAAVWMRLYNSTVVEPYDAATRVECLVRNCDVMGAGLLDLGCNVQEGVRMADMSQDRVGLAGRINRLEFQEYMAVGWFRVAPLEEVGGYACLEDAEVVARYARTPNDAATDRELIQLFLRNWLCCHHPESMGAYGLEVSKFRSIGRAEALAVVDQIIAASLEDPEARIGGCLDWQKPATPEETADVPYPQLREWFSELFGDECRFYLHDSAGGPTVRFNLSVSAVIGLAPDLVGMLWIE